MNNLNHEQDMKELIESLRAAGIEAQRYGRSGIVCLLPGGNYALRLSSTDCSLEDAKQFERDRLNCLVGKYQNWEKAALMRANEAELRAKHHRENAIRFHKMLEQLN